MRGLHDNVRSLAEARAEREKSRRELFSAASPENKRALVEQWTRQMITEIKIPNDGGRDDGPLPAA